MSKLIHKVIRNIRRETRRFGSYRYLPLYWWFHKHKFGITNTKFDISWCVFQESFIQDQYDIRRFLDAVKRANNLFFLDIGRNHGFVFYYTMYHIMRSSFHVPVINYVGIDPSPLKFVYFNYFSFLREKNIEVNYFLLDKAVVFSDEKYTKLKYGEKNFGNFHISESPLAQKMASRKNRYSCVEITVETIGLNELKNIVGGHKASDAMIIKIDCKNQNARLFFEMFDLLNGHTDPYLVACERDDSGDREVESYSKPGHNVLRVSNVFK